MPVPAVLFVVFNRPDTTAQVMEAIRRAKPPRLYVAADGPRDKPGEHERCLEARRIATEVDWPCEVKTLFRSENLRGPNAVSGAINWFFEHEEEGVILEDDCLPSQDFFTYCAELLERYRTDPRVMSICGACFADKRFGEYDYYCSYYADVWGWATWRRAWNLYDRHLTGWEAVKHSGLLDALDAPVKDHWTKVFSAISEGRRDHWDYPWMFTVMQQRAVALHPRTNLISNLGFRADASNTRARPGRVSRSPLAARALGQLRFPLHHPPTLEPTREFEDIVNRVRHGISKHPRIAKARRLVLSQVLAAGPRVGAAARRTLPPQVLGALDLLRFPSVKDTGGGPFNGQQARQRLFRALVESVQPAALVETGTFRGTTTEHLARYGLPVFTVDDDPRGYVFARARFLALSNVTVLRGDGAAGLMQLFEREPLRARDTVAIFYLNAHRRDALSFRRELTTVFEHRPRSVVLIDGFQVPFDRGYGYNDFGPGTSFGLDSIAPAAREHGLCVFYPATPSTEETGARRGCAVVSKHGIHTAKLTALGLLRPDAPSAFGVDAT